MEFSKAFSLIVLSLTAWSAFALLLDKRGLTNANRWFAALLLCLCLPQAYFYSRYIQPPEGVFVLALVVLATLWLKGPLLLVMVRLALGYPRPAYYWHLLPFALVVVAMLLRSEWMFEFLLVGFFHVMIYLLMCWYLFWQHQRRVKLIFSSYQNSAWFWLMSVVVGLSILMLVDATLMFVAYLERSFLVTAVQIINWTMSIYLLVLAFFSIYRPELFFHHQSVEETGESEVFVAEEEVEQTRSWRELNETLAQSLAQRLQQLMEAEAIYRRNELSLGDLASCLEISVHQASELLNVYFAESFYDYINRYRLAYACRLLENRNCQLRGLDIAFESGFSNKNSFYRYFRETYGMTPVEYRQRHHAKLDEEVC